MPVTARDFIFTHRAIREHLPADIESVHRRVASSGLSARRRFGSCFGPARRVAPALRGRAAATRARGAKPREDLGRPDREPEDGRAHRERAIPRRALGARKQLTLVRNPRYWGPHVSYLDRVVLRFCRACPRLSPAEVLDALRKGDVDVDAQPGHGDRFGAPPNTRHAGDRDAHESAGSTSPFGSALAVTLRCATSSCGEQLRTPSIASRSTPPVRGDRSRPERRATAQSS